jgi:hypothetical protein
LGLPPLLKNQLLSRGSEALGRAVTVGSVAFKPWTLELTLNDLAMATQNGGDSQLSIKRLYIDAEMESLFRWAPVVKAFSLDAPKLRLTHLGDGQYDIDDVIQKLAPAASDAPAAPESAEAPKEEGLAPFALFNLALTEGSVDFVDQAVNQTHQLRGLTIGIPFLNNLASKREVVTEPRLAFQLNGSSFDSAAQSTPFAPTRKTDASFQLNNFDLKPYLGYLPKDLPVQLVSAVLSADVKLAFEQTSPPTVQLSGRLELVNAEVRDTASQALLSFDSLVVAVDELRPLASLARLSEVSLDGAVVELRRDKAGLFNGLQLGGVESDLTANAADGGATDESATGAAADEATTETGAATQAADETAAPEALGKTSEESQEGSSPWAVEVAKLQLRDAKVNWTDEATAATPARVGLHQLTVEATDFAWPMAQPMPFSGSARVVGLPLTAQKTDADVDANADTDVAQGAALTFNGTATDQAAQVTVALEQLPLLLADPYLAEVLQPKLDGQLSTALDVQWAASGTLALAVKQLTLDNLALLPRAETTKATPLASIRSLAVTDAQIDLNDNTVVMGQLAVVSPQVSVSRGEDQRWMFEPWLLDSAPTAPSDEAETPAKPWGLLIENTTLDGGAVAFEDLTVPGKPVKLSVSGLKLAMKNTTLEGAKPEPLSLSGQIKGPRGEPGKLDFKGSLAWAPLAVQGSLLLEQLPIQAFEPYFSDVLNMHLLRADGGFKGEFQVTQGAKGLSTQISGDVALEEMRANALAGSGTGELKAAEKLLSWKTLSLRGLQVAMAPEEPWTVDLKETVLSDFYARVIVDPTGRINLQNLLKPTEAELAEAAAANTATVAATPSPPKPAETAAATEAAAADAGPAPVINLGPASLINGRVYFSDRFVKPNYSVNVSELTGKLGAFSSVPPQGEPQLADVELRGSAEGTATLEILGKINPLATPLALDITGNMHDLELPPLSPYSIKYAGYGMERGKLNVAVGYRITPDGTLTATNSLVLNQLTFGDKVEGATDSLPVKLAVALLADRHGVIDINLPVTGSLNDPEFSLAGVIGKVLLNLLTKAVTAPFSLLASALGVEGDALSVVEFAPGSSALSAEAQAGLDKVAQALLDRPALKLTVVGTASLQAEREGYKQAHLQTRLLAEKRRALVKNGQDATAVADVTQEESPALLKAVYKRADFPKPTNALGMDKDLPDEEMRALLLASIPVDEELMRALAVQRGVVVKDYLVSKQLPLERLFLGAVKPVEADGEWTPRADLNLGTK